MLFTLKENKIWISMTSQWSCDRDKLCVIIGARQWHVKWLLQGEPITGILLMFREAEPCCFSPLLCLEFPLTSY